MAPAATPQYRLSGRRGLVTVVVDQRDIDRMQRTLDFYSPREFTRRGKRIYLEAVKIMERPMRAAAPYNRYPDPVQVRKVRRRGTLRASVRARPNDLRYGEIGAATVGPVKTAGPAGRRAPHRFLVVAGTKQHSLKPQRAGKGPYEAFVPKNGVNPTRFVNRSRTKYNWRENRPGQDSVRIRFGPQTDIQHPGATARPFVSEIARTYETRVRAFINENMLSFTGVGTTRSPRMKLN